MPATSSLGKLKERVPAVAVLKIRSSPVGKLKERSPATGSLER